MTGWRLILSALVIIVLILVLWFIMAPPRWWLNLTKKVPTTPEMGEKLIRKYRCRSCHRIGGVGAIQAPDLSGITKKAGDPAHVTLRLWLRNPKSIKPGTPMPNFHLSDYEIEAIIKYLEYLDKKEVGP